MISVIAWVMDVVKNLVDLWLSFINPICNPDSVIGIIVVSCLVWLFVFLRHEYKYYGEKCWQLGGAEFFAAGFMGFITTMSFYFLPVVLFSCLMVFLVFGFAIAFQKLVIISVKGEPHG